MIWELRWLDIQWYDMILILILILKFYDIFKFHLIQLITDLIKNIIVLYQSESRSDLDFN